VSWELLGGIAIALVLAAAGVWGVVAAWGRQKTKGAVAKDDLTEADALLAEAKRRDEVLAQPTPKGRKLLDMLTARRKRREARK